MTSNAQEAWAEAERALQARDHFLDQFSSQILDPLTRTALQELMLTPPGETTYNSDLLPSPLVRAQARVWEALASYEASHS